MNFSKALEMALRHPRASLPCRKLAVGALRWFQAYEAMGEEMKILFFERDRQNEKVEIFRVDHKLADAIGVMATYHQDSHEKFLVQKKREPHHWFYRFLAFLLYPFLTGLKRTEWKAMVGATVPHQELKSKRASFVVTLGEEEFSQLQNHLNHHRLKLSAFLLNVVNGVMLKALCKREQRAGHWYLPVNMRAEIESCHFLQNLSSYVSLAIDANASTEVVQGLMRKRLMRAHHWGTWYWIQMGRFLSVGRLKGILEALERKGNRWMGTFSFLGEWPGNPNSKSLLGFAPPVTRQHPVGIGVVVYARHLLMGVNLHGCLDLADSEVDALREQLFQEIFSRSESIC